MSTPDKIDASFFTRNLATFVPVEAPEVHPVLIASIGTRRAEMLLVLNSMTSGSAGKLVPFRTIAIDTTPYGVFVTELIKRGWTREQVEAAIPSDHYLELPTPFAEDFDFDDDKNSQLGKLVRCKFAREKAQRNKSPGTGGIPILARALFESGRDELEKFFKVHIDMLTRLSATAMRLREGVLAFLYTSYCGGTGTGGSALTGSILRTLKRHSRIHACVQMPCIFRMERQEKANAYAAILANNHFHSSRGFIQAMDGTGLPLPFDSVRLTFGHNGRQAISDVDALMHDAEVAMRYLRVRTQDVIDATEANLNGATTHDLRGQPTHLRIELAQSIRIVAPGVYDYMAGSWIRQDVAQVSQRLEQWLSDKALEPREQARVDSLFKAIVKELKLDRASLLALLDGQSPAANQLRAAAQAIQGRIASMDGVAIKAGIGSMDAKMDELCKRAQATYAARLLELARRLAARLSAEIADKLTAAPHLALAAIELLRKHIQAIAKEAEDAARVAGGRSDKARQAATTAIGQVRDMQPTLGLFLRDEVVRDGAGAALKALLAWALAVVEQALNQALQQALVASELYGLDASGNRIAVSSADAALAKLGSDLLATARRRLGELADQARIECERYAQKLSKRSEFFQRALLLDQARPEQLDQVVKALREGCGSAPTAGFIGGAADLKMTMEQVLPLLPGYADRNAAMADLILSNRPLLDHIRAILEGLDPFCKLDPVKERQLGYNQRKDKLRLLEIPGGKDGALARELLGDRLQNDPSVRVVESGDQEIRSYYLRVGIPYYLVAELEHYEREYRQYMMQGGLPTPHVVPDASALIGLKMPDASTRDYLARVLYLSLAALPGRLARAADGKISVSCELAGGARVRAELADLGELMRWGAENIEVCRVLEAQLKQSLAADSEAFKDALLAAHASAENDSDEKRILLGELSKIGAEPLAPAAAGAAPAGAAWDLEARK